MENGNNGSSLVGCENGTNQSERTTDNNVTTGQNLDAPQVPTNERESQDEPIEDQDSEESDDESDSEEDFVEQKDLPPLSIFRIDLNKVDNLLEDSESGSSNENGSGESQSQSTNSCNCEHDNSDAELPYIGTVNQVIDVIQKLDENYTHESCDKDFGDCEVYVCVKPNKSQHKILSYLGIDHYRNQSYDTIIIIPVLDEEKKLKGIYAGTSGHSSWRLVQQFCDDQFSTEVSQKILDSDGATCHSVSCVLGIYRSKKSVFKSRVNLKNLEISEVCRNFSASVDKRNVDSDGQIRKDLLFPDFTKRKDIKSVVGEYYIKFNLNLDIPQIYHLVRNLELVYGDTTDKYFIKDSKLKRIVLKVNEDVGYELERELSTSISNFVNSKINTDDEGTEDIEFHEMGDFDVSFKNEKTFAEASGFTMKYDEVKAQLEDNPNFIQVMKKAVEIYKTEYSSDKQPFDFDNISLSFLPGGRGNRSWSKFQDYLRGHVYSKNMGKHYWLVSGKWYFVHKDYLLIVQEEFQDILNSHLVENGNSGNSVTPRLYLFWDSKSKKGLSDEEAYNNKYKKEKDFYVGDRLIARNIEYFDILYDDSKTDKSYLFHVKNGFNQSTRVVCSQLKNAAGLLTSLKKTGVTDQDEIEEIVSKLRAAFGGDEIKCRRLLGIGSNRILIYVLGLLTNPKLAKDLIQPYQFSTVKDRQGNRTLKLEKNLMSSLRMRLIFLATNKIP